MTPEIAKLRSNVDDIEQKLNEARQKLNFIVRQCHHEWGPITDCSEYKPGYTIPGDTPGTCGVDYRGPISVGSTTVKKWSRTCKICGHVDFTSNVDVVTTNVPKFN